MPEGWTLWAYKKGDPKTMMLLDWVYCRGFSKRRAMLRGRKIMKAWKLRSWVLEVRPFNDY